MAENFKQLLAEIQSSGSYRSASLAEEVRQHLDFRGAWISNAVVGGNMSNVNNVIGQLPPERFELS